MHRFPLRLGIGRGYVATQSILFAVLDRIARQYFFETAPRNGPGSEGVVGDDRGLLAVDYPDF